MTTKVEVRVEWTNDDQPYEMIYENGTITIFQGLPTFGRDYVAGFTLEQLKEAIACIEAAAGGAK